MCNRVQTFLDSLTKSFGERSGGGAGVLIVTLNRHATLVAIRKVQHTFITFFFFRFFRAGTATNAPGTNIMTVYAKTTPVLLMGRAIMYVISWSARCSKPSHIHHDGTYTYALCFGQGKCTCHKGWSGAKCNIELCEEMNCGSEGKGTCKEGSCICAPGYKGDRCQFVDRCQVPKTIVS